VAPQGTAAPGAGLPEGVYEVLEAFVMDASRLEAELAAGCPAEPPGSAEGASPAPPAAGSPATEALREGEVAARAALPRAAAVVLPAFGLLVDPGANTCFAPRAAADKSGLRLAVLTTLMRLLELKLEEMESTLTGRGPTPQPQPADQLA
jgi:hypothetical protein